MNQGTVLVLGLVPVVLLASSPAHSQSVAIGGRLYDEWWAQVGVDAPAGNQALWASQSTNTRSGAVTWRCKECHGWDYKGVAGAYGSGSHRTGFPGVLDAGTRLSEAELTAWLDGTANPDHDFSAMGTDQLPHLARFLKQGLVDMAPLIDAGTKGAVGGEGSRGQQLYQGSCAITVCHGADGTAVNFSGDPADPEFVGTVAKDNPWEFIHKVRVGQPGSNPPMPAGADMGWSMQDVVDLLTYSQTLPTATAETAVGSSAWGLVKAALIHDE
ncbi:MAG: c-type cytochrome [Candidatus Latescibacterota bacterium]